MNSSADGLTVTGKVTQSVYETERLRDLYPRWDALPKDERHRRLSAVEPDEQDVSYNVTVERFHKYVVDNLDPAQTGSKANLTAAWFALGNDGGSGTSITDTDLNNRTYEEQVTDHADNGTSLIASTFIASDEANNAGVLDELGLFTGDPANLANNDVFMINHATFSSVTKDNTKTLTFDVELTFSDG